MIKKDSSFSATLEKGMQYISKLSKNQRDVLLALLKKVQEVQKSDLSTNDKVKEIKRIMWTEQSPKSKLIIGGLIGSIAGLVVFGTGGIGLVGLGGAVGVWGFLAGSAGGVFISSLIQNFEKKDK